MFDRDKRKTGDVSETNRSADGNHSKTKSGKYDEANLGLGFVVNVWEYEN